MLFHIICSIFVWYLFLRAVCCVIIFGRDVYPIEESLNNRAGVIRTDRGGAAQIEDKLFDRGMRGGEMSTALDWLGLFFFVSIIRHLWQRAWWIAKEMRFCSVTQKLRRCRKMPLKGTGWTFKLIYATSKMVTATMIVLGLSGLVGAGHHHSYHHHKRSPHIRECQL